MSDLLHAWALVLGLNREVFWLTVFAGLCAAGLTAIYVNLSVWKGVVIAVAAMSAAAIALPWMHPLWQHFALQGGVAGLGPGESHHMSWIGIGAVAALAGALVGGRLSASVVETIYVVFISSAAMWTIHSMLTAA